VCIDSDDDDDDAVVVVSKDVIQEQCEQRAREDSSTLSTTEETKQIVDCGSQILLEKSLADSVSCSTDDLEKKLDEGEPLRLDAASVVTESAFGVEQNLLATEATASPPKKDTTAQSEASLLPLVGVDEDLEKLAVAMTEKALQKLPELERTEKMSRIKDGVLRRLRQMRTEKAAAQERSQTIPAPPPSSDAQEISSPALPSSDQGKVDVREEIRWTCLACDEVNKACRRKCNNCGKDRDKELAVVHESPKQDDEEVERHALDRKSIEREDTTRNDCSSQGARCYNLESTAQGALANPTFKRNIEVAQQLAEEALKQRIEAARSKVLDRLRNESEHKAKEVAEKKSVANELLKKNIEAVRKKVLERRRSEEELARKASFANKTLKERFEPAPKKLAANTRSENGQTSSQEFAKESTLADEALKLGIKIVRKRALERIKGAERERRNEKDWRSKERWDAEERVECEKLAGSVAEERHAEREKRKALWAKDDDIILVDPDKLTANRWEDSRFQSDEQKNKFLRLMGGQKFVEEVEDQVVWTGDNFIPEGLKTFDLDDGEWIESITVDSAQKRNLELEQLYRQGRQQRLRPGQGLRAA